MWVGIAMTWLNYDVVGYSEDVLIYHQFLLSSSLRISFAFSHTLSNSVSTSPHELLTPLTDCILNLQYNFIVKSVLTFFIIHFYLCKITSQNLSWRHSQVSLSIMITNFYKFSDLSIHIFLHLYSNNVYSEFIFLTFLIF